VPLEQLVLVHAGEELVDDVCLHAQGLSEYNRSDEARGSASWGHPSPLAQPLTHLQVFMKLQCVLREPLRIFLSSPACRSRVICENVEASSPVSVVFGLLQDRGLASSINPGCAIVVRLRVGV